MNLSNTHKAIIALIIANSIWGAASPVFKWALADIQPFTLAILRFYIASLIILPFAYKQLRIHKEDYLKVFLAGFFGIFINIAFFFLGLTQTVSINAPIIASASPVFVIFITLFLLKEKVRKKTIAGGIIGFIGVIIIVLQPIIESGLDNSILGNLYLVIAMLGATINILIGRDLMKKYSSTTVTFYSFFVGSLCSLPFVFTEVTTHGFLSNISLPGIVGIAFGAIFSSLAAYFLYYWGMKYLSASDVGLFTYMDPVIAILIAVPLLNEIPTPAYLVGAILVFAGIYIAEGRINYHPVHKLKKQMHPLPPR